MTPTHNADHVTTTCPQGIEHDRQQVEAALRESEQNLRLVLESTLDGFWRVDLQGRLLDVNTAYCRQSGYSREELLAMHVRDLESAESAEETAEHLRRIVERGGDRFESRHRRKDGSVWDVEVSVTYWDIGGGQFFSFFRDITARKQAEQALSQSEQRIRNMSDAAGAYLWEIDANMVYTYVSGQSLQVKGYPPEALLGHTPIEFMPAEDVPPVGEIVNRAIADKSNFRLQHRDITPSGEVLWEEVYGAVFCDAAGEVVGLRGTGMSINARKRAELALRESEEKFRQLFENMTAGFALHEMIYDSAGNPVDYRFLELNPAFERLTGARSQDLVGRTVREVMPGTEQYWIDTFGRVAQTGVPVTYQNYAKEIGKYFEAFAFSPRRNQFAVMFIDVTERQLGEDHLRRSEERIRNMSDAAGAYLWEIDVNMVYTYVSGQSLRVKGHSPEALLGHTPMEYMPAEDIDQVAEIVNRAIADKSTFRLQHRDITPSGEIWWEEVYGSVYCNADGEVLGLRGTGMSINARKAAEEELKRSNAELEQFSYSISHDMRQPLRMISSYLQLLETSIAGQLDADQRQFFGFAIDGAKRMDAMMLGLLDYSRVGRKGEPPGWVESHGLLEEALRYLQPSIAEAEAVVRVAGDWPEVWVSPDEILRLLQNLIGNAIKFRVKERVPEITVTSAWHDREWVVRVVDNGVGIIPDQIGRLFQVFQRLQSRAAYEGTGIGLALCRKIVEHHKGRIWVESAGEGQGSTFVFSLPMSLDDKVEAARAEEAG